MRIAGAGHFKEFSVDELVSRAGIRRRRHCQVVRVGQFDPRFRFGLGHGSSSFRRLSQLYRRPQIVNAQVGSPLSAITVLSQLIHQVHRVVPTPIAGVVPGQRVNGAASAADLQLEVLSVPADVAPLLDAGAAGQVAGRGIVLSERLQLLPQFRQRWIDDFLKRNLRRGFPEWVRGRTSLVRRWRCV